MDSLEVVIPAMLLVLGLYSRLHSAQEEKRKTLNRPRKLRRIRKRRAALMDAKKCALISLLLAEQWTVLRPQKSMDATTGQALVQVQEWSDDRLGRWQMAGEFSNDQEIIPQTCKLGEKLTSLLPPAPSVPGPRAVPHSRPDHTGVDQPAPAPRALPHPKPRRSVPATTRHDKPAARPEGVPRGHVYREHCRQQWRFEHVNECAVCLPVFFLRVWFDLRCRRQVHTDK